MPARKRWKAVGTSAETSALSFVSRSARVGARADVAFARDPLTDRAVRGPEKSPRTRSSAKSGRSRTNFTKIAHILGEEALKEDTKRKQSTRVPQGLIDRAGSLFAFQPPFRTQLPIKYTVKAHTRSTLLSIPARELGDVLEQHQYDAPVFMRAMQHAEKTLNPDKRTSTAGDLLNTADAIDGAATTSKKPSVVGNKRSLRRSLSVDDSEDQVAALLKAESDGWLPAAGTTEHRPSIYALKPDANIATVRAMEELQQVAGTPGPPPAFMSLRVTICRWRAGAQGDAGHGQRHERGNGSAEERRGEAEGNHSRSRREA